MTSLRARLITHTLIPLIVLAAALMWTSFDALEGVLERRLEKEIELVARSLRIPVQQAFAEGDLDRLAESLSAVFEIDSVYGANVFDQSGRRVVVAGQARPGAREQIQAAELVQLGEALGVYEELGGQTIYSYFVPLIGSTGRIIGLLQVVRQESDMAQWLTEVRRRGWALWGGMIGVILLLILLAYRRSVDRPIQELLGSMARIEAGEREHRAVVSAPKELAGIGHGLNRMLDAIAEMEQQLAQRQQEHLMLAERLREQENLAALGRFSAGVAHELGAPLTVIDGDARRLERDPPLDDEARRRVRRIREQVQRTRELIRRLMAFVRSDQPAVSELNVAALLQRTASSVRPQAEARGVELVLQTVPADFSLRGQGMRLEHALLNLGRNAIQAARSSVRFSAQVDQPGRLSLCVEDDGPGVAEADLGLIFEPFQSRRADGEGTGLGLAIVRSVANEHGAEIQVDRSPDLGGARFRLRFAVGAAA
ncbi:MAG: ATP-binding protein [Wenzhouxiangella sp.]